MTPVEKFNDSRVVSLFSQKAEGVDFAEVERQLIPPEGEVRKAPDGRKTL